MKIIHIVTSINKINFGVWNAAIFGSSYLKEGHKVDSELWICSKSSLADVIPEIEYHYFEKKDLTLIGYKQWLSKYNRNETIIITHGAWLQPTRLGYRAKLNNYHWIYVPHGMHEKWESNKGKLKKWIYFNLFERHMTKKADAVRAVSDVEKENLSKLLNREINVIYNGIVLNQNNNIVKQSGKLNFLFMARLQHKKGVAYLVRAWANTMYDISIAQLNIAGPDEGEFEKIRPYLKHNISYLGPQYGEKKQTLLTEAHYYVMPSFSEGFPTSVVEAMGYGVIPIISSGCNFPQVFSEKLGFEIKPNEQSIEEVLKQIIAKPFEKELSRRNIEYVQQNLTDNIIGENLLALYNKVLDA